MSVKISVLAATGTVGQKIITLLDKNPNFEIVELCASDRSAGKTYGEAVLWRELTPLKEKYAKMPVKTLEEASAPFALSALPADIAQEIEPKLAAKGVHVISNASAFRMQSNIPLVVPEINKNHFSLLQSQDTPGKIITNPNCSTVFAVLGLAPLLELGTIEHVHIVTLQALSGAGYPGVSSNDILGNIIPNIGGEEEKIETEVKKILGEATKPANFSVTAHVHRVPVLHGHTVAMHVHFSDNVSHDQVHDKFYALAKEKPELYYYSDAWDFPQPKFLTDFDQRAHVGRIKQGDRPNIVGLVSMGHNLVRGAAGAALVNLEAAIEYLK